MVPGFDLEKLDEEAKFNLPLNEQTPELGALECVCDTLEIEYKAIAVAEPFSKKRKVAAASAAAE